MRDFNTIIEHLRDHLAELRAVPADRKIAIAITHLETAILFLESYVSE